MLSKSFESRPDMFHIVNGKTSKSKLFLYASKKYLYLIRHLLFMRVRL